VCPSSEIFQDDKQGKEAVEEQDAPVHMTIIGILRKRVLKENINPSLNQHAQTQQPHGASKGTGCWVD
jgi:hypothetical protein